MNIAEFLTAKAVENGHTVFSNVSGDIYLTSIPEIQQTSGAVYGLAVELTDAELDSLRNELPEKKSKAIYQPIEGNWYALYWGKDLTPCSRVKAHVQSYEATGNANLRKYATLRSKSIKYAAIFVSEYDKYEGYLHKNYNPLLGFSKKGSSAKNVQVLL